MDTTNISLIAVIVIMAFFTGMQVQEYKQEAKTRAVIESFTKEWK